MPNDLFHFQRFLADVDPAYLERCYNGAKEKFGILFPGKRIITYDQRTLGVETDEPDAVNGYDIYELGLVDDEIPAMQCQRTEKVITFRIE